MTWADAYKARALDNAVLIGCRNCNTEIHVPSLLSAGGVESVYVAGHGADKYITIDDDRCGSELTVVRKAPQNLVIRDSQSLQRSIGKEESSVR